MNTGPLALVWECGSCQRVMVLATWPVFNAAEMTAWDPPKCDYEGHTAPFRMVLRHAVGLVATIGP